MSYSRWYAELYVNGTGTAEALHQSVASLLESGKLPQGASLETQLKFSASHDWTPEEPEDFRRWRFSGTLAQPDSLPADRFLAVVREILRALEAAGFRVIAECRVPGQVGGTLDPVLLLMEPWEGALVDSRKGS